MNDTLTIDFTQGEQTLFTGVNNGTQVAKDLNVLPYCHRIIILSQKDHLITSSFFKGLFFMFPLSFFNDNVHISGGNHRSHEEFERFLKHLRENYLQPS